VRPLVAAIAVASALGAAALRLVAHEQAQAAETYEDVYYLPPPSWLRVLSLGHREALADLLWCRALVYLGDEFAHQGEVRFVFDYTESMLALDPDFVAVYAWVATAGVYQPAGAVPEDIRRSVEILERGRARFPEDGRLAWLTGATLAFELTPMLPEQERDEVRLRGAEHLMDAVRLGTAPEWLLMSNVSVLERLGRAEVAAEFLEGMYDTISDDSVRLEIASRLGTLRDEAYGSAFVEASDTFEAARLRRYDYVHPSLYFLLAPVAGESWEQAMRDGLAAGVLLDPMLQPDD
jgi:hypothetical protein